MGRICAAAMDHIFDGCLSVEFIHGQWSIPKNTKTITPKVHYVITDHYRLGALHFVAMILMIGVSISSIYIYIYIYIYIIIKSRPQSQVPVTGYRIYVGGVDVAYTPGVLVTEMKQVLACQKG